MVKILGRRELMAYTLVFTSCAGFLLGKIPSDAFVTMVSSVLAFYFGMRKTEGGEK
jgi:hypothetical protein